MQIGRKCLIFPFDYSALAPIVSLLCKIMLHFIFSFPHSIPIHVSLCLGFETLTRDEHRRNFLVLVFNRPPIM